MALPAFVADLKDAPEGSRGEYVKGDGSDARPDADRFYLDVNSTDGFTLEDTSGLRSAIGRLRGEIRDLKRDAKGFDGLDPEKARDALERIEELEKGGKGDEEAVKQRLESLRRQLVEAHQQEVSTLQSENGELGEALNGALIDTTVTAALNGKGSVDLLLPVVRRNVRVMQDDSGSRVARVFDKEGNELISRKAGSNGAPMDVGEYVESLRSDARYAPAFDGSGPAGGGTPGMGEGHQKGGKTPPIDPSLPPTERLKMARRLGKTAETGG